MFCDKSDWVDAMDAITTRGIVTIRTDASRQREENEQKTPAVIVAVPCLLSEEQDRALHAATRLTTELPGYRRGLCCYALLCHGFCLSTAPAQAADPYGLMNRESIK